MLLAAEARPAADRGGERPALPVCNMTARDRVLKRCLDVGASAAGLLALTIPGAVVALLIKLTSRGPAFYVHTRVGRGGRPFRCVKFRTMYLGADAGGPVTTAADSRITPLGRVLRRYKLDELPQLWNVLIGDMSLVGPRPDVPGYVDRLEGRARRLLELRPGITGPASLYFRDEEEILAAVPNPREYNDTVIWPKKVEINLQYIETWSLARDLGYIVDTVAPRLRSRKA